MIGVLLTIVACLLMLCAVLVVLVIGRDRAARRAEADRNEAANEARAANRLWRAERIELEADLATARAELHALRRAVTAESHLTPDALPDDLPALDTTTLRRVWALEPTDFDLPGETR